MNRLPESNILLMEEVVHQLISSQCHYLQGFIHVRWLGMAFLPSTVEPENFDAWKTILPFWRPFGNLSTNRTVRLQGYKNQTYIYMYDGPLCTI